MLEFFRFTIQYSTVCNELNNEYKIRIIHYKIFTLLHEVKDDDLKNKESYTFKIKTAFF